MSLYSLTNDLLELQQKIESGEIPEEAISDTLEGLQGEFDIKVDNIACWIKNLTAEAMAIKDEETRLKDRRVSKENLIERLEDNISCQMLALGKEKIETARNLIGFRKSSSVYIDNEEDFKAKCRIKSLLSIEKIVKISKKAVKEWLESGHKLKGAEIRQNQNLYIK